MGGSQLISIVDVICHSFRHLDPRLINHGERVAYILMKMLADTSYYTKQEKQDIFMLGLLHDIGAYKEEEIDSMLSFDMDDTMEHSVFGYLLFQHFSPLPEYADVILYHHHCNAQYYPAPIGNYHRDMARLIYLADRIDIYYVVNQMECPDSFPDRYSESTFSAASIRWFKDADQKYHILEAIQDGSYQEEVERYAKEEIILSEEQIHKYLMAFIFSVDFRNEYTALHTSYAVHLSENFSNTLHLAPATCKAIQLAAALHNIGKTCIPSDIGSTDNYNHYLNELYQNSTRDATKEILSGAVDPQIIKIIDESFLILERWSQNQPLSRTLAPSAEIVALSYVLSNILAYDMELTHHPGLIGYLKEKYQRCNMDDTILLALEKYLRQIIQQTQSSCVAVARTYHHVMDEYHYLRTVLLNYNVKYKF
ncbi:HD domain-containing protein [Lachnospiraceae bacterium JLR.KK009]|nr:hypothetical protein C810_02516 [Lachnospiraceae bacterium A2]MCI8707460.1 HD domain-containing protein [Lachnospiraceae bacterium]MCI8883521.1 HD domain-containing protein [Lachnospiraceae bacterium]